MADEPIVITVQDQVATSIAPKLAAIESNALGAMDAFTRMSQAAKSLNGDAFNRMASAVGNASSTLNNAAKAIETFGNQVSASAQKLANFTRAMSAANTQAAQLIATLQGLQAVSVTLNSGVGNVTNGLGGFSGGARVAGAELRAISSGFSNGTMLAGRFLSTLGPMQAIMTAAFAPLAIVALISFVAQLGNKIHEIILAFKEMSNTAIDAAVKAAEAGDKIVKIQQSWGDKARRAILTNGADTGSGTLVDTSDLAKQRKRIEQQIELAQASTAADAAGKVGKAAQDARVAGIQREIDLTKQLVENTKAVEKSYVSQATAEKTTRVLTSPGASRGGIATAPTETFVTTKVITDPAQQKYLQDNIRAAANDVDDFNAKLNVLNENLRGAKAKDVLAGIKDGLKEARAQLKQFNDELANLKKNSNGSGDNGLVTAEDILSLRQKQAKRALPQNKDVLDTEVGNAQQRVNEILNKQQDTLQSLRETYQGQIEETHLYGEALTDYQDRLKITQALQKAGIDLNGKDATSIYQLGAQAAASASYHKILDEEFASVSRTSTDYGIKINALTELFSKQTISAEQYVVAISKIRQAQSEAANPLTRFTQNIQDQQSNNGLVGQDKQVNEQVNVAKRSVQSEYGDAGLTIFAKQLDAYKVLVEQQTKDAAISTQLNSIYDQTQGKLVELTYAMTAYNEAKAQGLISDEQFKIGIAQVQTSMANLRLQAGDDANSIHDLFVGSFSKIASDIKPPMLALSDALGNTLKKAVDGISEGLASAIVQGKNLGDTFKQLARTILTDLLAAVIKLIIEQLILKAIMTALGFSGGGSVPESGTGGSATGDTYDGMARGGFVRGFARGGMVPQGLAYGGFPRPAGIAASDTVPAWLTPGEFVMPQKQARMFRPELMAMRGANSRTVVQTAQSSQQNQRPLNVNVQHDGSTGIQIQQGASPDEMHIIAKTAVEEHAPKVITDHLNNPNSGPSKAITKNYTGRNRT